MTTTWEAGFQCNSCFQLDKYQVPVQEVSLPYDIPIGRKPHWDAMLLIQAVHISFLTWPRQARLMSLILYLAAGRDHSVILWVPTGIIWDHQADLESILNNFSSMDTAAPFVPQSWTFPQCTIVNFLVSIICLSIICIRSCYQVKSMRCTWTVFRQRGRV